MYYEIMALAPRTDLVLGRWGFGVSLWPEFRDLVAASGIGQQNVDQVLERCGRHWLDGCGYSRMFDPDDHRGPLEREEEPLPPGPNARHLHTVGIDFNVRWGEWGPEHIAVPGNACGLDIVDSIGGPRGGRQLCPHNVDSMSQTMLLLIVFTYFAESVRILANRQ